MLAKDLQSHPVLGPVFLKYCQAQKVPPSKRKAREWLKKYGSKYQIK